MAAQLPRDGEITVGDFTISVDAGSVWITKDVTGEGGTYPGAEVKKVLKAKQPARALRKYFEENFP